MSILQHIHTFPTFGKFTFVCLSSVCKEPSRYNLMMFLQLRKTSDVNLPTQISPDVWIPHDSTLTPANTITLMCPERATETITIRKPVHILKIPTACSTTSSNFHLPPRYQTSNLDVNASLNMANLHMINASALDFHVWQYLRDNRSETQLQHLTTLPSILVHKIYQHMINGTQHVMSFNATDESTKDTDSIWTLFLHTGMYVKAIGSLIPSAFGVFCYYFFWY